MLNFQLFIYIIRCTVNTLEMKNNLLNTVDFQLKYHLGIFIRLKHFPVHFH